MSVSFLVSFRYYYFAIFVSNCFILNEFETFFGTFLIFYAVPNRHERTSMNISQIPSPSQAGALSDAR